MRNLRVFICLALAFSMSISPAFPASKKVALPAPANPACAGLAAEYENASKQIAMNTAENLTDNSAVRVTMRETQNGNSLEKARMTLDLMKGNSCKMPTAAPGASRYLSAAISCELALSQQMLDRANAGIRSYDLTNMPARPQACDMGAWQPSGEAQPSAGSSALPVSTVHALVPADPMPPPPSAADAKIGKEMMKQRLGADGAER